MSEFERFECESCGTEFKAHPDATAGRRELCSPSCETDVL